MRAPLCSLTTVRPPCMPCSMCMPFRSMERIWPFGRMLALPPPLRATVRPGGVRFAALVVVPGLPPVPGLPMPAPPDLPTVPGLVVVPVLPIVPGLFVVPVRLVVPFLVPVVVVRLGVVVWPAVVWPAVAGWAGAAGLAAGFGAGLGAGALGFFCPQASDETAIKSINRTAISQFSFFFLRFIAASWTSETSQFIVTSREKTLQIQRLVRSLHGDEEPTGGDQKGPQTLATKCTSG